MNVNKWLWIGALIWMGCSVRPPDYSHAIMNEKEEVVRSTSISIIPGHGKGMEALDIYNLLFYLNSKYIVYGANLINFSPGITLGFKAPKIAAVTFNPSFSTFCEEFNPAAGAHVKIMSFASLSYQLYRECLGKGSEFKVRYSNAYIHEARIYLQYRRKESAFFIYPSLIFNTSEKYWAFLFNFGFMQKKDFIRPKPKDHSKRRPNRFDNPASPW